uniref:SFRICE_001967 n=1 Tax=Spodoptera frugiperda TaxID=7108 RepID=A0A2H1VGY8_SPOFR
MKVTVCFGSVRVLVPCGAGDLLVRDLVREATHRYKKATGQVVKLEVQDSMALPPKFSVISRNSRNYSMVKQWDRCRGEPAGAPGMLEERAP